MRRASLLNVVLILAACDDEGVIRLRPQIKVTPESIDFGDVPTGATKYVGVTIENTGSAPLELSEIASPEEPFGAEGLLAIGPIAGASASPWAARRSPGSWTFARLWSS